MVSQRSDEDAPDRRRTEFEDPDSPPPPGFHPISSDLPPSLTQGEELPLRPIVLREPVLVGFTLRTKTIDDDKDPDTGIFVEVWDKNGNQIAYIENAENSTHYNSGRDEFHEFRIDPLRSDIAKDDCLPCTWRMGIKAAGPDDTTIEAGGTPIFIFHGGNDHWTFDAWLYVVFSDNTSTFGDKLGQGLESNNHQLVWDDPSPTGAVAG